MTDCKFWINDIKVLMQNEHILDVWAKKDSSLECKLNAMSRLIIFLTVLGYIFTRNTKILISGFVALAILVILYFTQSKKTKKEEIKTALKEGFTNPKLYEATKQYFTQPTKENPMMNVQQQEYKYNNQRKQAAPAYNKKVEEEINESVKSGLDKRLFQDLGDNVDFDNSMRQFYTTANTQIPNDQKAFAEFCYGGMTSCKDSDIDACEKKNYRHILR